ncbi:hypothetical protein J6590_052260, partial [Homalodisca vitripennis]
VFLMYGVPQASSPFPILYLPVELTLGTTKPLCHLNLGNLMVVQKRHITSRKCRNIGVQG